MLKVFFRAWKTSIPLYVIQSSPSRFLSATFNHLQSAESNLVVPKTESSLDLPKSTTEQDEDKKHYNERAIMDLVLEKFDDELLYLPEVIDENQWVKLVDRGMVLEECMQTLKYDEFLSTGKMSAEMRTYLGTLGLFKHRIPRKYGGLELNETEATYLHEIISLRPSIARILSENDEMGIKVLVKYGTEEQKQKYLPKLATGESMVSMAFLEESSAILDPKSYFGLTVTEEGGKLTLNGTKKWVSNANVADIFVVFATHTEVDEKGPLTLNTLFLVDKATEGVRVHKPFEKNWFKGFDMCEVVFDDVVVGPGNVLGGYGRGLEVLRDILKLNKTLVTAECSSLMKRLLHDAVEKCSNTANVYLGGKPLCEFPYSKLTLGELSCAAYAVESVTYYLTSRNDYYNNPDLSLEIFLAKVFTMEALPEALQSYFNLVGKYGYIKKTFVEELVQNANFYPIFDDNIYEMKLLVITRVIQHLAKESKDKIKMLSKPLDNPGTVVKHMIGEISQQLGTQSSNLDLPKCLNLELSLPAEDLQFCIAQLKYCGERHLLLHKNQSLLQDYSLLVLADMLVNTFALIACIARANRAASLNLPNYKLDLKLTQAFSSKVVSKVRHLSSLIVQNEEEREGYVEIGNKAVTHKTYPADHPLMRNF